MKTTHFASLVALTLGLHGHALAHGGEDHGQSPATTAPAQQSTDGGLFVPKALQRQLGLRTVLAEVRDVPTTQEFNGKVVADANAGGRVQASQPGRIEPPAQGLPALGQSVRKGQVLAYLRPALTSTERGNGQAQWAELGAQLAIAERKAQRYDQLEGALAQAAIDAARLDRDALRQRRIAIGESLHRPQALVAPISGVVSAAYAVAGQVVDAKEVLFEVVDVSRLAVEALAYDAALATDIASAHAIVPQGRLELQFVGASRQLRGQAMPLLFRVKSGAAALAIGQPVKVIALGSHTRKGTVLAQAALVKTGAGEAAVWVHTRAEHFVLRKVQAAPLNATQVVLTSGIGPGERVVTEGAGLLAQVR